MFYQPVAPKHLLEVSGALPVISAPFERVTYKRSRKNCGTLPKNHKNITEQTKDMATHTGEVLVAEDVLQEQSNAEIKPSPKEEVAEAEPPKQLEHLPPGLMMRYLSYRD